MMRDHAAMIAILRRVTLQGSDALFFFKGQIMMILFDPIVVSCMSIDICSALIYL